MRHLALSALLWVFIVTTALAQGPNGAVARCKDGSHVLVATGDKTCAAQGGVDFWYPTKPEFAEPQKPTTGPNGAVAQCGNGQYVFKSTGDLTCVGFGGVARWFGSNAPPKPTSVAAAQPGPNRSEPAKVTNPFLSVPEAMQQTQSTSPSCHEATVMLPSPFLGNDGEVIKLSDGSFWRVRFSYEYMYEYFPRAVVCPSTGKLLVAGKSFDVERLGTPSADGAKPSPGIIQSRIDGDFEGWDGDTIFTLMNGQIWQQAGFAYKYSYRFSPRVTIVSVDGSYEMQVEGVEGRIRVRRLK